MESKNEFFIQVLPYGAFFLLGCLALIVYFVADGSPSANLVAAAALIILVQLFAYIFDNPQWGWGANIPLLVAIAHYLSSTYGAGQSVLNTSLGG